MAQIDLKFMKGTKETAKSLGSTYGKKSKKKTATKGTVKKK